MDKLTKNAVLEIRPTGILLRRINRKPALLVLLNRLTVPNRDSSNLLTPRRTNWSSFAFSKTTGTLRVLE